MRRPLLLVPAVTVLAAAGCGGSSSSSSSSTPASSAATTARSATPTGAKTSIVAGAIQGSGDKRLSTWDREFLTETAAGTQFEISSGRIALKHASSPRIKAQAQRYITDHANEQRAVNALAAKLGVKVEDTPTTVQKHEIGDTASHSGKGFDRAYARLELADHKMDVSNNDAELNEGTNPLVLAFTKHYLPMYRKHYVVAERNAKAVGAA